jgi:hypothetical protein
LKLNGDKRIKVIAQAHAGVLGHWHTLISTDSWPNMAATPTRSSTSFAFCSLAAPVSNEFGEKRQ